MDGYFVSENYGFRKGYLDHTTTKYINVVLDVVADAKGYDRDNPNTTLYFKDDWTFHVSLEDFQNFKLDEERNKILTAERSKESKKVERDRSLRESIAKMEAELAEMRGQLGDNS
jgi:hypothetical protein